MLLVEDESTANTLSRLDSETNRALHCMAAHLYRYGSELSLLAEIVEDIKQYNQDYDQEFVNSEARTAGSIGSIVTELRHISTQLSSLSRFRDELYRKTDNILALARILSHPLF